MNDVCANRHRGNANSVAAHNRIAGKLPEMQRIVFDVIDASGAIGVSLSEICAALERPPNAISGRITELKKSGLITKTGCRINPQGNRESIYVATH